MYLSLVSVLQNEWWWPTDDRKVTPSETSGGSIHLHLTSTFSFPFYFRKKILWFHDYLSLLYESIVCTFQHSSLDLHHPFTFGPRCNRIPYFRFPLPTFILLASVVNQDSAWSRSGNETERERERKREREDHIQRGVMTFQKVKYVYSILLKNGHRGNEKVPVSMKGNEREREMEIGRKREKVKSGFVCNSGWFSLHPSHPSLFWRQSWQESEFMFFPPSNS